MQWHGWISGICYYVGKACPGKTHMVTFQLYEVQSMQIQTHTDTHTYTHTYTEWLGRKDEIGVGHKGG